MTTTQRTRAKGRDVDWGAVEKVEWCVCGRPKEVRFSRGATRRVIPLLVVDRPECAYCYEMLPWMDMIPARMFCATLIDGLRAEGLMPKEE